MSSLQPDQPAAAPDWSRLLQRLGPLLALILLVAFTAWRSDRFLTGENIMNILRQNAPVGILALGMTFVITLGGIDLSVGALLAMAGGVGIWMMNTAADASAIIAKAQDATAFNPDSAFRIALAKGCVSAGMADSPAIALTIGICIILLVGLLGGVINGLLVTRGKLAPFIATLGTMAIFRSIAVAMAEAGEFRPSSTITSFRLLGASGISLPIDARAGVPLQIGYPVVAFLLLVVVLWVVLRMTRFGRYVIAIGCNEQAAIYSAIKVARVKLLTYTLMGTLTGLAALLQASRFNSVSSSSSGLLYELDAIAAAVIGGTSMRGGVGTILGTLVGMLMLGVIGNMLNLLDISPYLQGLVKGVILIGAALLQRGRPAD